MGQIDITRSPCRLTIHGLKITAGSCSAVLCSYDAKDRLSQTRITAAGTDYYIDRAYNASIGLQDTLSYPTSTAGYRFKVQFGYG